MNVAVPYSLGNIIPKCIGETDTVDLQRFDIDPEDGTIYTRSTIHSPKSRLVVDLQENKVEVLVCDAIAPELESEIKALGIKLIPGVTGNSIQAARDAASK